MKKSRRLFLILISTLILIGFTACTNQQNSNKDIGEENIKFKSKDIYGNWALVKIYPEQFDEFKVQEILDLREKVFDELELKLVDNKFYENIIKEELEREKFEENPYRELKDFQEIAKNLGYEIENLDSKFTPVYFSRDGKADTNVGLDQTYILLEDGEYMIYTKNYKLYNNQKKEFGALYKKIE